MQFLTLLSAVASALVIGTEAASVHGAHGVHNGIARRMSGDLAKRTDNSKWSYYDTETGNAGACGRHIRNSEFVVAMNTPQYKQSDCFKRIVMTYNGKTTTATIGDMCPGCPYGGLDLSVELFKFFAPSSVGIIYGEWHFEGQGGAPPPPPPPPKPTTTKQPEWTPPPPPKPTTTKKPEWTPPPAPSTTKWTPKPEPPPPSSSASSKAAPTTTSTTTTSSTTTTTSSTTTTSTTTSTTEASTARAAATTTAAAAGTGNFNDLGELVVQIGGLVLGGAAAA